MLVHAFIRITSARRLAVAVLAACGALGGVGVAAAAASGHRHGVRAHHHRVVHHRVRHNPRGHLLGVIQAVRGSRSHRRHLRQIRARAADSSGGPLLYNGGPVMHSSAAYAIYWDPGGGLPSDYASTINGYFQNLAATTGVADVYALNAQYTDSTGSAAAGSSFGGSFLDTNPYPANGCTPYSDSSTPGGATTTRCLSDGQLETEIQRVVHAQGWPHGLGALYFIFTPNHVGICAGGSCAYTEFCAYHSNFADSGNGQTVLYAVQPYADLPECSTDKPNASSADPTLNVASHEHNEAITDPLGTAWFDASGNENGDKCVWDFGAPLGGTVGTDSYNQVLHAGHYELQQEWDNSTSSCRLRVAPTAAFSAPTDVVAPGDSAHFDGSASSTAASGAHLTTWSWDFGDGTTTTSGLSSTDHTYSTSGAYTVRLAVTDSAGGIDATTRQVLVDLPPVAVPAATTAAPFVAGQPIGFSATGSHGGDSNRSVSSYAWTFDDGSSSSQASPSHAFSTAGTHTATLVVTDDLGVSSVAADVTVQVGAPAPPTAAFTVSPASAAHPGDAIAFDGSATVAAPFWPITSYAWSFGDGQTGSGRSTSHRYGAPGSYHVTLTVRDGFGHTASTGGDVVVAAAPSPAPTSVPLTTSGPSLATPFSAPPPVGVIASVGATSLKRIGRNGLPVRVRCSKKCTLVATLSLDRATARRIGLSARQRTVVIGSATGGGHSGLHTVRIHLRRGAALAIARSRRLAVTLRLRVAGPAGRVTLTRRLLLTR